MNSIGRICIYVYISSNTRIYSISPKGFIQACVSATLLQGGSSQNKNIYIYIWLDPPYSLWEENAQDVANGD